MDTHQHWNGMGTIHLPKRSNGGNIHMNLDIVRKHTDIPVVLQGKDQLRGRADFVHTALKSAKLDVEDSTNANFLESRTKRIEFHRILG